jgi:uncharacterized protein
MTEISPTRPANDQGLRKYFYGPYRLRAGWRLLIFLAIMAVLFQFCDRSVWPTVNRLDVITSHLVGGVVDFLAFLLGSWIMAKIEKRTIADYGLPWRRMFGSQFWQGALLGFGSLTSLLVIMRALGVFYFGKIALHGTEVLQFAGLYGAAFVIVGVREEFHDRGYGLFVLSECIGFWPAAVITSALFGASHLGNSGENWFGAFQAGAGGLFFCFLLRRTGNLWTPIGFHMAWDWGQTFFYGVPDSGLVLPGHLLNPSISGPAWLSGGSVGPEGSVLCIPLLVVVSFVVHRRFREAGYPAPEVALPQETTALATSSG